MYKRKKNYNVTINTQLFFRLLLLLLLLFIQFLTEIKFQCQYLTFVNVLAVVVVTAAAAAAAAILLLLLMNNDVLFNQFKQNHFKTVQSSFKDGKNK